jgi:hypothetical protein
VKKAAKKGVRKMPVTLKPTGELTPYNVEDKKATRVRSGAGPHHGMPKKIKTPDGNMPNNSLFHNKKVVKEGKHMAMAGGVGHKDHPPHMLMAKKAVKNRKKRG